MKTRIEIADDHLLLSFQDDEKTFRYQGSFRGSRIVIEAVIELIESNSIKKLLEALFCIKLPGDKCENNSLHNSTE